MRLEPIPPDRLDAEQRSLYEKIEKGVDERLKGFVAMRADGALVGPFNYMLHFPKYGAQLWADTEALIAGSTLAKPAHEIAILVTGARFRSRYEVYAHEHVAANAGLSASKIATIVAGERPSDLTSDEGLAYDVAAMLTRGGQLPEATYRAALAAFGEHGLAELVYLVGSYCTISVLLNAYDVSVPGREEGLP